MAECPDVAPECAVIQIPPHLHRASVGLTHYEMTANYGLRPGMQLSVRVPYDIKAMRIRYTTLEGAPYTPPYGDIHHRTETLTGISDPTLSVEWSPRPGWMFGAGTSLPAGQTVPNPIILGREGKRHEHIQFGSGTFMPALSGQWWRPAKHFTFFARGEANLSVYENDEGFRAPNTFLWSIGPSVPIRGMLLNPRLQGQYQSLARWDGETDEGTGFSNGGVLLQLSLPAYRGVIIAPGLYHELDSHGHHDETFRQGTTWSLSITRTF